MPSELIVKTAIIIVMLIIGFSDFLQIELDFVLTLESVFSTKCDFKYKQVVMYASTLD